MAPQRKVKLQKKELDKLLEYPPATDVYDTELPGFHVRPTKKGLTFRLYYRTKAGKQRMLTIGRLGVITATQARKDAITALAAVTQGGDPRAEREEAKAEEERQQQQTLGAYLDGPYTVTQRRKKDGNSTLQRIRKAYAKWIDKPMSELTRADVERWQAERENKGEAYNTSKRHFGALKTLLNHAAERKVIHHNPLAGVSLEKPALNEEEMAEQASQRRYLEPEEVKALFIGLDLYQDTKRAQRRRSRAHGKSSLPDLDAVTYVDHVAPFINLMYFTGFRPGDLFGLRWDHVHMDFSSIYKTIEKTAHHDEKPRRFPLSSEASRVLKTWHQQQGEPKSGLVFPSNRNGKRMDKKAMQKPWATIRKLACLPEDLLLYTLRHNFASQLVMAGIDLLTVSKLMAHTDIQTTIKYYAHLSHDHSQDAVNLLSDSTKKILSANNQ